MFDLQYSIELRSEDMPSAEEALTKTAQQEKKFTMK
jgi:hypothetical protein